MDDGMDVYLGRMIKNWAAQHQPPTGGKRRLLEVAAAYARPITQVLVDTFHHPPRYEPRYHLGFDHWTASFHYSQMWSYYQGIGWRVAT